MVMDGRNVASVFRLSGGGRFENQNRLEYWLLTLETNWLPPNLISKSKQISVETVGKGRLIDR